MMEQKQLNVENLGKITDYSYLPDLIEIQIKSYEDFLQYDVPAPKRQPRGLEAVFQETFLQIHQSAGTFDVTRRFRPWLFTIAANKARDMLRRKGRRPALDLSAPVAGNASDGESGGGVSFIDLMEVDVPAPDAALDSAERDAMVQEAIASLSPTLREILLMAYFQRLSYVQIAEDLEIPLGTVKSRLHAAVASFAKQWQRLNESRSGERE